LQKESFEKKKLEEKIKQFNKEKNEWNKILAQQTMDIDALHESILVTQLFIAC